MIGRGGSNRPGTLATTRLFFLNEPTESALATATLLPRVRREPRITDSADNHPMAGHLGLSTLARGTTPSSLFRLRNRTKTD